MKRDILSRVIDIKNIHGVLIQDSDVESSLKLPLPMDTQNQQLRMEKIPLKGIQKRAERLLHFGQMKKSSQ